MVTIADCERVQAAWFTLRSATLDAGPQVDGPLTWLPDGRHLWLMFPRELPAAALARGVERARDERRLAGVWINPEVDPGPLAAAGFDRGWKPWWMSAPLASVGAPADPRVVLRTRSGDYRGEHAGYAANLALTRVRPRVAWYAAAYDDDGDGRTRLAGHAWSFRPPDEPDEPREPGAPEAPDAPGEPGEPGEPDAPDEPREFCGIFDLEVWPRFQRRGYGSGLLRAVCAAAAATGATHAVLNATPAGKPLYRRHGFADLGPGSTWWWHPPG